MMTTGMVVGMLAGMRRRQRRRDDRIGDGPWGPRGPCGRHRDLSAQRVRQNRRGTCGPPDEEEMGSRRAQLRSDERIRTRDQVGAVQAPALYPDVGEGALCRGSAPDRISSSSPRDRTSPGSTSASGCWRRLGPAPPAYPGTLELRHLDVHDLDYPDGTFDQALRPARSARCRTPSRGSCRFGRVLKAGGQLHMFEHTGSRYFPFNAMLDVLNPLARRFGPRGEPGHRIERHARRLRRAGGGACVSRRREDDSRRFAVIPGGLSRGGSGV